MANHISTQNESKLKIAKQSYKGVKFMKSCSKLQKLPFKTKVAHKTKSCQKVAEQLVETPTIAWFIHICIPLGWATNQLSENFRLNFVTTETSRFEQ
jgi:hypothetical protein